MKSWCAMLGLMMALVASGCEQQSHARVSVDGSSTVFPITEAIAEEFRGRTDARVTIGVSGTGGGFKKFCRGETAIIGASRPIRPVESKRCEETGVEYIELPVAYDGIVIVVHPSNDWVQSLTPEELGSLWRPEAQGKVTQWNDMRDDWPARPINLYGAGIDSGTYDYFTKAVVGREHASRGDFTSSEDDNVLVQGVANDQNALGFFGFAYYAENAQRLKAVPIDDGDPKNGQGPIAPSTKTIGNGSYQPLSRPLFLYVRKAAARREPVQTFLRFYLSNAGTLSREVGYVALPKRAYDLVEQRFEARTTGSVFDAHGAQVGVSVEELLAAE